MAPTSLSSNVDQNKSRRQMYPTQREAIDIEFKSNFNKTLH